MPAQNNSDLALVRGTIYASPRDEPIRNGTVLIHDGKIARVGAAITAPPGVPSIDCSGLTIAAGFWNSHVHFFERKWANAADIPAEELGRQLREMLTRYGFTSVFDLSSPWENTRKIRDRVNSGEVPGPRIRSTGMGLLPKDPGLPGEAVMNFMGVMKTARSEVADAEQAGAAARELLDGGVDGIKLFISAPSKTRIPESAMEAAVKEARRAGKPVFVHPNSGADVMAAVQAGVDVIGHTTPFSGPWDGTLVKAMAERGVALTPTLTIWKYYMRHDRASVQEKTTETEIGQLRAWIAAGGTVLFGTDLGAIDPDPSEEYALMRQAGMSFRQILASLTIAPAERFGESGRLGQVAEGLAADLAVFRGESLTDVAYTLRDGKIIYRATHTH